MRKDFYMFPHMKTCDKRHSLIVYQDSKCPVCNIAEHSDHLHDFIEKNGMVDSVVKYLNESYVITKNKNDKMIIKEKVYNLIDSVKDMLSKIRGVAAEMTFLENGNETAFRQHACMIINLCNQYYEAFKTQEARPVHEEAAAEHYGTGQNIGQQLKERQLQSEPASV